MPDQETQQKLLQLSYLQSAQGQEARAIEDEVLPDPNRKTPATAPGLHTHAKDHPAFGRGN